MPYKYAKYVKHLIFSIEIFLLFFLQTSPFLLPDIFGVKPMVIAVGAICISIFEDEIPALFIGLFAGVLMDISFGKYFGLFAIIMAFLCCIVKVIVKKKNKNSLIFSVEISAIFIALVILCDWLFRYCLVGYSSAFVILIDKFLPIYFYSLLCIPILYLINYAVHMMMRTCEDL